MYIDYKIHNGFKSDVIADTSDDTKSGFAPSSK